ncbi:hypothetical protein M6B38_198530 [Iris pallida]|uniref:ATP synthase F0 subunit 8 n=1 Tax=Iris pallida TaxID=29817 RepID=A0AAX6EBI3_IRIPA|nr:hypothetical protein M6B38_198530 [Iris pallida]
MLCLIGLFFFSMENISITKFPPIVVFDILYFPKNYHFLYFSTKWWKMKLSQPIGKYHFTWK